MGFAGDLTITHTTFADNGLALNSQSTTNAPPLVVVCQGGTNPVSCTVTITDSLFDNNHAQEALAVGLTCSASPAQLCDFAITRTNFTRHQLLGPGSTYTTPYGGTDVGYVDTTASALVVKAGSTSSFTLTVGACNFADNEGAGLWVVQERDPVNVNPQLLADILISGSSFTGHTLLPGGMHAVTVLGARSVSLTDTLWQGNTMGAFALEVIQDVVACDSITVMDNIANLLTQDAVDIFMMDSAASIVSVTHSLFSNNSGFSTLSPGPPYTKNSIFNAFGMLTLAGRNGAALISISVSTTQFVSNYGFFSVGAFAVYSALEVSLTDVEADSNIGGAVYLSQVQTVVITNSSFRGNQGLLGGLGVILSSSTGGAAVTVDSGDTVTVSGCYFEDNDATASGAAMTVSVLSSFQVTACKFRGNRAWTGSGGALFVKSTTQV